MPNSPDSRSVTRRMKRSSNEILVVHIGTFCMGLQWGITFLVVGLEKQQFLTPVRIKVVNK